MNSNPHNNQGFQDDGCLTEQMMLDYTNNKLTPHERHLVEKHTLDCEFCADALEGFALIRDHGKLDEAVFAVHAMTTEQPVNVKKRTWWDTRMKVAASVAILVLLVSVYYFQGKIKEQTENVFAENFEEYPAASETGKLQSKETAPPAGNVNESISTLVQEPSVEKADPHNEINENPLLKKSEKLQADLYETDEASQGMTFATGEAMDKLSAPAEDEVLEDANLYREESKSAAAVAKKQEADMDAKKPLPAVEDNLAVIDTKNNNSSLTEEESIATTPNAGGYKYHNKGSNDASLTAPSPTQSQGLATKQDAFTWQSKKKANDNAFVLKKSKTRSKSTFTRAEDLKDKESEAPAKEQPANAHETQAERASVKQANKAAVTDSVTANGPLANAMKKYKAGQHNEAILLFEQTLVTEPLNTEALFYSSISYLAVNLPDKALSNLEKVLSAKGHTFTDAAKWYKALAYLKKGEKKTAKALLQEIEKGAGAYKQKAAEALKDLD